MPAADPPAVPGCPDGDKTFSINSGPTHRSSTRVRASGRYCAAPPRPTGSFATPHDPPRRETCQLRWRHPTHHPRRARLTRRLAAVRLDAWGIPYGTVAYTYGTSPLVSNSRPSQDRPRRGRSTYSARTVWSGPRHAQPPQAGSLPAGSP
ncbi:hypothetical protein GPN2_11910 [Streptomyces murinus]